MYEILYVCGLSRHGVDIVQSAIVNTSFIAISLIKLLHHLETSEAEAMLQCLASMKVQLLQRLETSAPRSCTTSTNDEVGTDVTDTTCMSSTCWVCLTWASLRDIATGLGKP
jgi:hypothetical protein